MNVRRYRRHWQADKCQHFAHQQQEPALQRCNQARHLVASSCDALRGRIKRSAKAQVVKSQTTKADANPLVLRA